MQSIISRINNNKKERCFVVLSEEIETIKNEIINNLKDKVLLNDEIFYNSDGSLRSTDEFFNSQKNIFLFDNLQGNSDRIGMIKQFLGSESFYNRSVHYKGENDFEIKTNLYNYEHIKVIILIKNLESLDKSLLNRSEIIYI